MRALRVVNWLQVGFFPSLDSVFAKLDKLVPIDGGVGFWKLLVLVEVVGDLLLKHGGSFGA